MSDKRLIGGRFEIVGPGPVAVQGKEDCTSVTCTRTGYGAESRCIGWHCPYCGGPCSMMGHDCAERRAAEAAHEATGTPAGQPQASPEPERSGGPK